MSKKISGLEGTSAPNEAKRAGKYTVANTADERKQLVNKKEQGEIGYHFVGICRNGDVIFAVEEVNE